MRRIETGIHDREFRHQRFELRAVALNDAGEILHLVLGLLQIGTLPLPQLAGILDALLETGHFGAGAVEACLDGAQGLGLRGLIDANALDTGLRLAQVREHRVHGRFAARRFRIANARLQVQSLQTQRQQFGLQLALLLLEHLVAARGGRLPLQMADLLLHLLAQIIQPVQVLAGLGNSILRFAAPLLVARNAGRLFEERAQIIRPRLDDPGDHALLDDRVTAGAEARAQEQLGDVLAAHLDAVDVVVRGSIAADGAPQRHLVVVRVGAADLAFRIVEHQLNRCGTERFACGGAVENDVGHRLAAQMLGGDLTHHPAHGIDDVRFAAAVRTHHTRQAAGKGHRGRIDKGFEACNLEFR